LVLLAPEGSYDIEITDGEKTLSRNNIQLLGTGNVIGASDPGLVGYVGLGSAGDPEKIEDGFFSSSRLWSTIIFVFAVLGISALLFARKKARGK